MMLPHGQPPRQAICCPWDNIFLDGAAQGGHHEGMRLGTYLQREGLTLAEFGARVGVDKATVHHWVRATKRPEWSRLPAIREATGGEVTASDFEPGDVPALDTASRMGENITDPIA